MLYIENDKKYPISDDQKIIRNDHLENKLGKNGWVTVTQGARKDVGEHVLAQNKMK